MAKEYENSDRGSRLYLVSAIEIEPAVGDKGSADSEESTKAESLPAGSMGKVDQLYQAVKEPFPYFSVSRWVF